MYRTLSVSFSMAVEMGCANAAHAIHNTLTIRKRFAFRQKCGWTLISSRLAGNFYQLSAVRRDREFELVRELAEVLLPPEIAHGLFAGKVKVAPFHRHRRDGVAARVEQTHGF